MSVQTRTCCRLKNDKHEPKCCLKQIPVRLGAKLFRAGCMPCTHGSHQFRYTRNEGCTGIGRKSCCLATTRSAKLDSNLCGKYRCCARDRTLQLQKIPSKEAFEICRLALDAIDVKPISRKTNRLFAESTANPGDCLAPTRFDGAATFLVPKTGVSCTLGLAVVEPLSQTLKAQTSYRECKSARSYHAPELVMYRL
jgi:hypothetical protein